MGCGVNLASPTRHAQRLTLPAQQRERVAGGGTERCPPNPVVAQARYFPIKNQIFDHALRRGSQAVRNPCESAQLFVRTVVCVQPSLSRRLYSSPYGGQVEHPPLPYLRHGQFSGRVG